MGKTFTAFESKSIDCCMTNSVNGPSGTFKSAENVRKGSGILAKMKRSGLPGSFEIQCHPHRYLMESRNDLKFQMNMHEEKEKEKGEREE